jgi:hypothetical protein
MGNQRHRIYSLAYHFELRLEDHIPVIAQLQARRS